MPVSSTASVSTTTPITHKLRTRALSIYAHLDIYILNAQRAALFAFTTSLASAILGTCEEIFVDPETLDDRSLPRRSSLNVQAEHRFLFLSRRCCDLAMNNEQLKADGCICMIQIHMFIGHRSKVIAKLAESNTAEGLGHRGVSGNAKVCSKCDR